MSTYRLEKLFCPRSITIVGASPRERSLGRSIARNLRAGGFGGPLHIVNPNYEYIDGLSTVTSIEAITEVPDIVVIAVPPAAVPEIVAAAGAKGRGGDHYHRGTESPHRLLLRLVGPNCLGVMALLPRSTSFRPIAEVSCRDEACGSAHHWARELIKLGHDARMMPPAYVKPYVRRQKNDAADAAGIAKR